MSIRSSLREGLLTGFINLCFILLGLTGLAGTMVRGWLHLSYQEPGVWLLLFGTAVWGGTKVAHLVPNKSSLKRFINGLIAGIIHGLLLAVSLGVISALLDSGADLRKWLAQLTPDAVRLLTFGLPPLMAAAMMFLVMVLATLAGVLLVQTSERYHWRQFLVNKSATTRERILSLPALQSFSQRKDSQYIVYGVGLLVILILPLVLGQYWNYTLGTVGIYVILGLGLNIVVGLAGLLDLGYVAFFAIGAYTVAILTAPAPHHIMMNFWLVIPIGIALAALAGVLLGIPVLRMRGDYLAIVTLGFGEIIRILSKSDVLTDFTGGPRGIRSVGGPSLFGFDISNEFYFMYIIILGIILAAYITNRLQHSRVGRAWMAMREDEDVAQAVGIYTLKFKLLAFASGAAFAGFGGVIFASRNKFTGPEDFTLLVSINVLCLVIIGGMGSIPGVIAGALVLKGLPEILRQLADYRMLAFGALLIVMMIVRPEGLWPSSRRQLELHEQEELPGSSPGAGLSPGAEP